jgi:hypothetical protein
MRFLGWLKRIFRREQIYSVSPIEEFDEASISQPKCDHPKSTAPQEITIHGVTIVCEAGAPICPKCAEEWLRKVSNVCAKCGDPILPGTSVARAWEGAKYPYTHLTFDCCEAGVLYCGVWGEGRLITLHELDSEKYPKGTASVMQHVAKTGETVCEQP